MNFTGSNEILKIWQTRRSTFETLNLNISVNIFTRLSDSSVPHILCCVNSRVCPGCALYKLTISSNQVSIVYSLICMYHLLNISPFFLRLYCVEFTQLLVKKILCYSNVLRKYIAGTLNCTCLYSLHMYFLLCH